MGTIAVMQISGNEILANLGLVPKPQPGGPRPQARGPQAPQSQAPQGPAPQGQAPQGQTRQPAQDPPAAQSARGDSAGLSRAQNLEQAVQDLRDQGPLPPRGSLVDLRA